MQKGDLMGLGMFLVIIVGIVALIALAPKTPLVVYAPVEITGSSLATVTASGEQLVQTSAFIKQTGFVTVHQAMDEAPGPLIGVSELLLPGDYANLEIETSEPLVKGMGYFVLLFADDGDQIYEPGVDLPVMSEGQVVKRKLSL